MARQEGVSFRRSPTHTAQRQSTTKSDTLSDGPSPLSMGSTTPYEAMWSFAPFFAHGRPPVLSLGEGHRERPHRCTRRAPQAQGCTEEGKFVDLLLRELFEHQDFDNRHA